MTLLSLAQSTTSCVSFEHVYLPEPAGILIKKLLKALSANRFNQFQPCLLTKVQRLRSSLTFEVDIYLYWLSLSNSYVVLVSEECISVIRRKQEMRKKGYLCRRGHSLHYLHSLSRLHFQPRLSLCKHFILLLYKIGCLNL